MVVEPDQVQRHTVGGERGQTAVPAAQVGDLRIVQRDRQVRGIAEDLVDQAGEHPARADLDEAGDAVGGHRLDHFAEPHRLPNLVGELSGRLVTVGCGGGVGVDGQMGLTERQRVQVLGERRRALGDDRRMERGRHSEPLGPQTGCGSGLLDTLDLGDVPGDDHLTRTVVVGDDQGAVGLRLGLQKCTHLVGARDDRQHRGVLAAAGLGHQQTTGTGRLHQPVGGQHTGRSQRGDLTETVTGGGGGLDAEFLEQRELGEADRGDRGLSGLHRGQRGVLYRAGLVIEGRFGEDGVVQVGQIALEPIPHGQRLGEVQRQVGAHTDVVAALPGEQERGLALARSSEANRDVGVLDGGALAVGECCAQLLREHGQRAGVGGDKPGPGALRGVEVLGGLERDPGEALPRLDLLDDGSGLGAELGLVRGTEHDEFGG